MKVWLMTKTGSKHAINVNPLRVFDNVEYMGKQIYEWWKVVHAKEEKRIKWYQENSWNKENWTDKKPMSFFEYVNNYSDFVIFEAKVNSKKKKLNQQAAMDLLRNTEQCKKHFTKGMLKE